MKSFFCSGSFVLVVAGKGECFYFDCKIMHREKFAPSHFFPVASPAHWKLIKLIKIMITITVSFRPGRPTPAEWVGLVDEENGTLFGPGILFLRWKLLFISRKFAN